MFPAGSTGIGPVTQDSTASYAEVVGSRIDRSYALGLAVGYSFQETGGVHGVTYKIQASIEGILWGDDGGEIPVPAGTFIDVFGTSSGHRYYRIMQKDTVGGLHGSSSVWGYAH